jgi:transcriptional regulator GlxA family with amidase domain
MTNLTPVELIGIYRLNKADEMLRTSNVPIKEVAFLTGFSSQYYFSRKYKEHFGHPPSQQKV